MQEQQGGTIDALTGLAQHPMVATLLQQLAGALVGSDGLGFSPGSMTPGKSMNYHLYQQQENRMRAASVDAMTSQFRTQMMQSSVLPNTYRMLGYSQEEAARMASTNTPFNSALSSNFALGGFVNPTVNAASNFLNAGYNRRGAWDASTGYQYFNTLNKGLESLSTRYSRGEFGSYTQEEMYNTAARMLGSGKYDNLNSLDISSTGQNERISKITEDLKSYSTTIANLKDSLDGPLDTILNQFENFLGGASMLNTRADRLDSLSTQFRNNTIFGGVSKELQASLAGAATTYVSGFGGDAVLGSSIGMSTGSILSQGIGIEGVTQQGLADASTKFFASQVSAGKSRDMTAAFTWYVQSQKAQGKNAALDQATYTRFKQSLGSMSASDYIKEQGVGSDFYNSTEVDRNISSLGFITADIGYGAIKEQQDTFLDSMRSKYTNDDKLLAAIDKTSLGSSAEELQKIFMEATGGDINKTQALIKEYQANQLVALGGSTADPDTAAQFIRNTEGAAKQQSRSLVQRGLINVLTKDGGTSIARTGLDGIINALTKDQGIGGGDVATYLNAFYGLSGTNALDESKVAALGKGGAEAQALAKELGIDTKDIGAMSKLGLPLLQAMTDINISMDPKKLSKIRKDALAVISGGTANTAEGADILNKFLETTGYSKEEQQLLAYSIRSGNTKVSAEDLANPLLKARYNVDKQSSRYKELYGADVTADDQAKLMKLTADIHSAETAADKKKAVDRREEFLRNEAAQTTKELVTGGRNMSSDEYNKSLDLMIKDLTAAADAGFNGSSSGGIADALNSFMEQLFGKFTEGSIKVTVQE